MIISKSSLLHPLAVTGTLSVATISTASLSTRRMPLHPKFHAHIKCPYAEQWLAKGPEQAAIDLGLGRKLFDDQRRYDQRVSEETIMGSCTYTNPFSGDSCMEFRGSGWTTDSMADKCSQEESSFFTEGKACSSDDSTAGYCIKAITDETYEYSVLALSSMADCAGNKMACETFVGGSFEAAAACGTSDAVMGSCTYTNVFSGDACTEFRGSGWTSDSMEERCSQEDSSAFTEGGGCASNDNTAGYCVKATADDSYEYNLLTLSEAADCDGTKMACETFVGGSFEAASACGGESSSSSTNLFGTSSSDSEPSSCGIAPGAIGAAHQNAFSPGYSRTCPGTPAEGSPYMWPLKWAADYETMNMQFGSDEVVFTSRGRTFYSLDNNWKRSDTTYQLGMLRTIGQGPCSDADEEWEEMGLLACNKNQTDGTMTTMLHKGNMMYFLSWKDTDVKPGELDATKIEDCSMINLQVIGNIRPDWFLDSRGDDTATQYLGNQHVFYNQSVPKLVKQWRKKDFASQYFTMSMMENTVNTTGEDSVKWPLLLNIPGEGFGDDMLQRYSKHQLLSEDDDELFTLVERYQELGGTCVETGGGEGAGPPILEVHIPSALEIDEGFMPLQYTFSPVWQDETSDNNALSADMAPSSDSMKAVTVVSDRVTVESCFEESTNFIDTSVYFFDVEATNSGTLPWIALGFRSSDVCAMTPPDGSNTPIILITHSSTDSAPVAHSGELLPGAKAMSQESFDVIYESLVPLEDNVDYSSVSVNAPMLSSSASLASGRSAVADDDTVTLNFKRAVGSKPGIIYLTYAIGTESQLGVHTTRACFELAEFPPCPTPVDSATTTTSGGVSVDIEDLITESSEQVTTKSEKASASGILTESVVLSVSISAITMALMLF